ncbi:hypothetical protein PoB_003763100 [Plakobranchus ocellatus]|uniref:Uncharacterized protein n=1 Tax=Plakobranchus ocellatus TaxID=259542 RepID=A0AAV4AIX1_9GAST|nr:hypothetical protein PoB_003763100 [Plakobranchus ocellatus]
MIRRMIFVRYRYDEGGAVAHLVKQLTTSRGPRIESQSEPRPFFIAPLRPPSTKWVAKSIKTLRRKGGEEQTTSECRIPRTITTLFLVPRCFDQARGSLYFISTITKKKSVGGTVVSQCTLRFIVTFHFTTSIQADEKKKSLILQAVDVLTMTQDNITTPQLHKQPSPQQGDLRLRDLPSGRNASGGVRTRDRRIPADLRTDSLATMPPTLPSYQDVNLLKTLPVGIRTIFLTEGAGREERA